MQARKGSRGWHTSILVPEVERSGLVVGSAGDIAHVDELSAAAAGEDAGEKSAGARQADSEMRLEKTYRRVGKMRAVQALQGAKIKGNAGSAGLRVGQQQRPSSGAAAELGDTAMEGA